MRDGIAEQIKKAKAKKESALKSPCLFINRVFYLSTRRFYEPVREYSAFLTVLEF